MPLDPKAIRERRDALKLTQAEAAERGDMPQPAWARIESGARTDPNVSTAEKVARALKCTVDQLLEKRRV